MFFSYTDARARFALAAALTVLPAGSLLAHGFAGQRFFPATILTDDPFVADEMSIPQVARNPPGPDGAQESDIQIDLAKRITPDTGVTIRERWRYLQPPGLPAVTGLGGLQTGAQYQLFVNGPREALGLVGLNVTWAHTGRVQALGAPDFTTLSPTFDFGKGLGDLPRSLPYLRPFAITGNLGFDLGQKLSGIGSLAGIKSGSDLIIEKFTTDLHMATTGLRDGMKPTNDALYSVCE